MSAFLLYPMSVLDQSKISSRGSFRSKVLLLETRSLLGTSVKRNGLSLRSRRVLRYQSPSEKIETVSNPNISSAQAPPEQQDSNLSPYAWFVAILLLAINVHNQWARALVYYLVSFKAPDGADSARLYMNKDLGFGEDQYALLASFGFTALFTTFSLLAGRVADKFNRAQVVAAGAGAWSLAGVAQASAASFDNILGMRALTGVSQAFLNPQVLQLQHDFLRVSGRRRGRDAPREKEERRALSSNITRPGAGLRAAGGVLPGIDAGNGDPAPRPCRRARRGMRRKRAPVPSLQMSPPTHRHAHPFPLPLRPRAHASCGQRPHSRARHAAVSSPPPAPPVQPGAVHSSPLLNADPSSCRSACGLAASQAKNSAPRQILRGRPCPGGGGVFVAAVNVRARGAADASRLSMRGPRGVAASPGARRGRCTRRGSQLLMYGPKKL